MATKKSGKKSSKKGSKKGSTNSSLLGGVVTRVGGSPILITGGSITVEFPEDEGYYQDPTPAPGFDITLINPTALITGINIYDGRTYKPGESTNVPVSTFTLPPEWADSCVIEITTSLPD
ncbi:MAG: hypothetical protein WCF57_01315 [Pyrinomonadaceae bacterium]